VIATRTILVAAAALAAVAAVPASIGKAAAGRVTPDLSAVVLEAAHDHYAGYGYVFPVARIAGLRPPDYPPDPPRDTQVWAIAAAGPGVVYLAPRTRQELQILGRVMGKPTVMDRLNAWRACGEICVGAASTALHQTAHLVQWHTGAMSGDDARYEGLAEAVALDLHRGFLRRILGRAPGVFGRTPTPLPDYWGYVIAAREQSASATGGSWTKLAARAWRFLQLGTAP